MLLAAVFFVQYAGTILENLGTLGLAAGALILLAMSAGSLLSRVFRTAEGGAENHRYRGRDAERRAGHRHRRLAADLRQRGRWPLRPSSTPLLMNVILLVYLKLLPKYSGETAAD